MKTSDFILRRVRFMPDTLEPGVLYVSEQYRTAQHLCACGCGAKIRTPLGSTEWTFTDTTGGPTLSPSIGNWQQACQSHYLIKGGKVRWAGKWTERQIRVGRRQEHKRRQAYYDALYPPGILQRLSRWLKSLFRRWNT
jgi:hypothetical protein